MSTTATPSSCPLPTGPAQRRGHYTRYPFEHGMVYINKHHVDISFGKFGRLLAQRFQKEHGGEMVKFQSPDKNVVRIRF